MLLDGGPSRGPRSVERRSVRAPESSRRPPDNLQRPETNPEPQPTPKISAASTPARPQHVVSKADKPVGRFTKPIIAAVAVILLCLVGWLAWSASDGSPSEAIKSDKNQAVFFASGQVYFGKLEVVNSNYLKLSDVFYVQSGATTDKPDGKNPQQPADGELELIKLGKEVHGPEDAMIINRDQVLFFENLTDDGKVSQLIQNYKSGKS